MVCSIRWKFLLFLKKTTNSKSDRSRLSHLKTESKAVFSYKRYAITIFANLNEYCTATKLMARQLRNCLLVATGNFYNDQAKFGQRKTAYVIRAWFVVHTSENQ